MGDSEHIRTIEIEGQKLEIDLRTAKKIECFRVGDKVKVLTKTYSGYVSSAGVIVGIDAFKKLPTVVIAHVRDPLRDESTLEFVYLNSQSTEIEICPMVEDDIMPTLATMREHFDRSIATRMKGVEELIAKKEYFLRKYGAVVGVEPAEVIAGE